MELSLNKIYIENYYIPKFVVIRFTRLFSRRSIYETVLKLSLTACFFFMSTILIGKNWQVNYDYLFLGIWKFLLEISKVNVPLR